MVKTGIYVNNNNNSILLCVLEKTTNFQGQGDRAENSLVMVFVAMLVGYLPLLKINNLLM